MIWYRQFESFSPAMQCVFSLCIFMHYFKKLFLNIKNVVFSIYSLPGFRFHFQGLCIIAGWITSAFLFFFFFPVIAISLGCVSFAKYLHFLFHAVLSEVFVIPCYWNLLLVSKVVLAIFSFILEFYQPSYTVYHFLPFPEIIVHVVLLLGYDCIINVF